MSEVFPDQVTTLDRHAAAPAAWCAEARTAPPHAAGRLRRVSQGLLGAMFASASAPYSRLFLVDDNVKWALSWEMREVERLARQLGIRASLARSLVGVRRQAVFHASQFVLLQPKLLCTTNRLGFAYFHGRPRPEAPEFTAYYEALCRHHPLVHRVQVTNSTMRSLILESGIVPEKVFLIPIGINLSYFPQRQTPQSKAQARRQYGLPQSAVVIGSFQKDGAGWGEGLEPKRIKGPDLFLQVIERLRLEIPELFVLLSAPSRGYVKQGLERLGVPYRHLYVQDYRKIDRLFETLDLYLVTSREEGGPKAILEAMASGVPLVTSRVGQAVDMVRHGQNAWMADVEDVDGLVHWSQYVLAHRDSPLVEDVLRAGRRTAEANAYEAQLPLWRAFMEGFVEDRHG